MLEDPKTLIQQPARRLRCSPSNLHLLSAGPISSIVPSFSSQPALTTKARSEKPLPSLLESISATCAQKSSLIFSRFISWTSRRPALAVMMASTLATSTNVMIAISQVSCSRCWYTKVLPAALGPTIIGAAVTTSTWVISRTNKAKQYFHRIRQLFQK